MSSPPPPNAPTPRRPSRVATRWRLATRSFLARTPDAAARLGVVALLALVAVVVVRSGRGDAAATPALGSGSAWITTLDGALLVNGASGEPQETVKFRCEPPGACTWRQGSGTLVAWDASTGTAHVVDPATLRVREPVPIGDPGVELAIGGAGTFAVDRPAGSIRPLDHTTFAAGPAIVLDHPVDDTIVDDAGRLFAVEHGTGQVVTVIGGERHATIAVGAPGDDLALGSTRAWVYVVDRTTGTVSRLDDDQVAGTVHLDQAPAGAVAARAAPVDLPVVLDPASRTITRADLSNGRAEPVGSFPPGSYGPADGPFVVGTRVAVLDHDTHVLHVFDTAKHAAEKDIDGVTEAVVKDGYLYANNPAGPGTVLRSDGARIAVDKGRQSSGGIEAPGTATAATPKTPAKTPPTTVPKTPKTPKTPAKVPPKVPKTPTTRKPLPKPPAKVPARPRTTVKLPPKVVPKLPARPGAGRPTTPTTTGGPPTTTTPTTAPGPTTTKPPVISTTAPATPPRPTAVAEGTRVTVTWGESAGAPTSAIVASDQGQEETTGDPGCSLAERTCVFEDLTDGQTYRFTVTAVNDIGKSAPSEPSDPVTPSATPPEAPGDVTATYDAATKVVHVTWTGADPRVTGYTAIPNDLTDDLPQLEVTVPATVHDASFDATHLTYGSSYRFRVRATTRDATAADSDYSDVVVPVAAPAAMGAVTATEPNAGIGATSATLSWAAVAANGAPVTYHVQDQTGTDVATTTATSYEFDALTPGDDVTLTVVPTNDLGTGAGSKVELVSYLDQSAGPAPGAVVNLDADVTETHDGATYTFTYHVQNAGPAVCLPAAAVRVHSDGTPDQVQSVAGICLAPGQGRTVSTSVTLAAGTYTYAALWTDAAAAPHPYSNGPIVEHDLVVP